MESNAPLLLIDNGSKHTAALKTYLKKRGVEFVTFTRDSRRSAVLEKAYCGVILSGGPANLGSKINMDEVAVDLAVLLNIQAPTLGICLGHQIIAEAYGGRVEHLKERVDRMETIEVLREDGLFTGLPRTFEMREAHTDVVTSLPFDFEVIAESKSSVVEGIQHNSRPIYGVQFHPEVSGELGERLLDNFLGICGIETTT